MTNKLLFSSTDKAMQDSAYESIKKEQSSIGYYSLPDQDIKPILNFCKTILDDITTIAIIGIGGSSLGAKAIYNFLKPNDTHTRKLCFFETTDPANIISLAKELDEDKTHFIVISKSGTTIETFAIFKYFYNKNNNPKIYTFITDKESPLENFAKNIGSSILYLPEHVGGRFSVLSSVALVPLKLCGVDILALLKGAHSIKHSFFKDGYIKTTLLKKATYYAKYHAQYHINCIFAYSESLKYFCEWYVQLWGESLGKHQRHSAFNVGLTPIGLIGPKDQHSFLQLLVEGTRDKSVTFIKIKQQKSDIIIPDISLPNLESLDTINTLPFSKLINMQCDSVIESLKSKGDIPIDIIELENIDEYSIGSLIFYYELLTSLVGELIDVDTYNQPGVEEAKIILKEDLKSNKSENK